VAFFYVHLGSSSSTTHVWQFLICFYTGLHFPSCAAGIAETVEIKFLCQLWDMQGLQWRSWLRHCVTGRKVLVLIRVGVTEIFH